MTVGLAHMLAWCGLVALGLGASPFQARAQYYTETFDASFPPPDWVAINFSGNPGTPWFRGNSGVFPAQAGEPSGYVAANFLASNDGGGISSWLFSAPVDFQAGDVLTFYTRAENVPGSVFSDGLVVRIGAAGTLDPLAYSTVLLEIGPVLAGPYPTQWTLHGVVIPEDADPLGSRFAFEYFAEEPDAASYIGLDTMRVYSDAPDSDGDVLPDSIDNCPTVANPGQEDSAGGLEVSIQGVVGPDGVGDVCDNCVRVNNPRVPADYLALNAWATLTGGQRDDDHDGYGNRCDAKFVGLPSQSVGGLDLAQFRSSIPEDRRLDTCGTTSTRPCAIFDLDEAAGNAIGGFDLARVRVMTNAPPGPRCAACTGTGSVPLPCTAGTAGSCVAP